MDIIKKLKKDKKPESIFDSLIKKEHKEEIVERPEDVEVTEIGPVKPAEVPPTAPAKSEPVIKREFRTEGMHEFSLESLSAGDANIKIEYKSRINALIDEDRYDEAIELLNELKEKLKEKS